MGYRDGDERTVVSEPIQHKDKQEDGRGAADTERASYERG
jgi:hypothetical protein